ncbi:MAG TPA: hypothetical protein VGC87_00180 [Pyrinomonadaceae bacterium]|jgi:hypothetical protein
MKLSTFRPSSLLLLAAAFALATLAAEAQVFKKCDPNPLPLQLGGFDNSPRTIDFKCDNGGCPKTRANVIQNKVKNNFCAPTDRIVPVTDETFAALQAAVEGVPGIIPRTPPESRAALKDIITLDGGTKLGEGDVVVYVAYVISANHSNVDKKKPLTTGSGESVQCNLLGCAFNDIHVELNTVQGSTKKCNNVTAEIIPHYRPPAWERFDSLSYRSHLARHPVRMKGQLFFDGSHIACKNGQSQGDLPRLSVWEIHPVYAIDVCTNKNIADCRVDDESVWFPFSELQSRLGLASVSRLKKCVANTTTPVSKCAVPNRSRGGRGGR